MDAVRLLAAVPVLPVSDERRAVAFHRDALRMTEVREGARGLGILRRDSVEIHLWVPDGRPGADPALAGSASCRIEATGVDALFAACTALGVVHPAAPLGPTAWGTREFAVLDPDGNLVTPYQRTTPAA